MNWLLTMLDKNIQTVKFVVKISSFYEKNGYVPDHFIHHFAEENPSAKLSELIELRDIVISEVNKKLKGYK